MRKLYSLGEIFKIIYDGIRTIKYFKKCEKNGEISKEFTERIMLAVTEVNKCEMCTYYHTKTALEIGIDNKEIQQLLSGETANIPSQQLAGVLFAQHYADSRCKPSLKAWQSIVSTYGEALAKGILGAVRMISMGNCLGIVFGSLSGRFKGKPDKRSTLLYELSVIACLPIILLAAFIGAMISKVFNISLIKFKEIGKTAA